MTRTAVILFNLGGPDRPDAIQPFLANLFNDPAIIGLPWPFRPILAQVISQRRQKQAREIYDQIGGKSPLLEQTWDQARALQQALNDDQARVFVAMRYWHPMAEEVVEQVKEFAPDRIVLLPLYPQFSTTTSASSVREWKRAAKAAGLDVPTHTVCCYPTEAGLIEAQAKLVGEALEKADDQPVRLLFSAHGLPEKIVKNGDPYQWQVEQTASAVMAAIGRPELDWLVCYQSRVGPLAWIGPSTDDEIKRAGTESLGVIVIPIAFVSEHSETLVELDIEYAEMAGKAGVKTYIRVPALQTQPSFIEGLAGLVGEAFARNDDPASNVGRRLCPPEWAKCPCRQA
ncbi:MAG: ferrochelatase [Pseudomonadota bacterium]